MTHPRSTGHWLSLLPVAALLLLSGCSSDVPAAASPAQSTAVATTPTPAETSAEPEPAETTSSPAGDPAPTFNGKPSDFDIAIKIRSKQCYGDSGCNITYRISPHYVGKEPLPDIGLVEVTYEVSGVESGPQVNTFTVAQGRASFDSEEDATTSRTSAKLKAKATDVSYDPDKDSDDS